MPSHVSRPPPSLLTPAAALAYEIAAKRQKRTHETSSTIRPPLGASAFLGLYAASLVKPTARDCLVAIGSAAALEDVSLALAGLPANDSDALDRYCVKLWAILKGASQEKGGKDFYKLLNDAVIADDPDELRRMMPIARVLNKILVSYFPPTDVVTFRGSQLKEEQLADLQVGSSYRVAMFVASSLDFDVAERFVRFEPGRIIVELSIPKECHNAGFLGVEFYPEQEREYLMPPYTAIQVLGKGQFREYVLLKVRVYKDNKQASLELPSILL